MKRITPLSDSRRFFESAQTPGPGLAPAGLVDQPGEQLVGSGWVRLSWTYPQGDPLLGDFGPDRRTVYSRTVRVTVH